MSQKKKIMINKEFLSLTKKRKKPKKQKPIWKPKLNTNSLKKRLIGKIKKYNNTKDFQNPVINTEMNINDNNKVIQPKLVGDDFGETLKTMDEIIKKKKEKKRLKKEKKRLRKLAKKLEKEKQKNEKNNSSFSNTQNLQPRQHILNIETLPHIQSTPLKPLKIQQQQQNILGPPKNILEPPKNILLPPKNILLPPKHILLPPKNILEPPKNILLPPKNILGPPKNENREKINFNTKNEVILNNPDNTHILNNMINKVKLPQEPVWGCLKNGKKPTYSQYKKSLKNKKQKIKIEENTIQEKEKEQQNQNQNPIINRIEKLKNVKKKNKKIIKTMKRWKLGKNGNFVSVLVKSKKIRNLIKKDIKVLKKTPINKAKKYLFKHNLIKVGSQAPDNIVKQIYEDAFLSGDIYNSNPQTLLHNFIENGC